MIGAMTIVEPSVMYRIIGSICSIFSCWAAVTVCPQASDVRIC